MSPSPSATQSSSLPEIEPVYSGFAPLATCHLQCLANVLEQQGLRGALHALVLSWGFSWNGTDGTLDGSGRYLDLANRTYGLSLSERTFMTWDAAHEAECALLDEGIPVVVRVDAYELPSPYFKAEHVHHTVIVLPGGDGVRVLDTTNQPRVVDYDVDTYARMRTGPCVEDFRIQWSPHGPERRPTSPLVSAAIGSDLLAHGGDEDVLAAYVEFVSASDVTIDVCRVAAERLYLAGAIALACGEREGSLAAAMSELAERWYLLHTLAMSAHDRRRPQKPRQVRLLEQLAADERRLREAFETMAGSDR